MLFADRTEAGKMLAPLLSQYVYPNAVVLALPRGGVVVAVEVARALTLPLDIVSVRKVGHPHDPEFAIGAVDERGVAIMNGDQVSPIEPQWLTGEIKREKEEAKRRADLYRDNRPPLYIPGKCVILVDDGIATGLTMRLAAQTIKEQHPEKIIVAVPVAPQEVVDELRESGIETITLEDPSKFLGSVGSHYILFTQVSDDEVLRALRGYAEDAPSMNT